MSICAILGLQESYKCSFNIREVVDLEDFGSRIGTVLGEAAVYTMSDLALCCPIERLTHGYTMSIEVLAK